MNCSTIAAEQSSQPQVSQDDEVNHEEDEQDEELELEERKCAEISAELTDMCNEWTARRTTVSSDDDWTDGCSTSSQEAAIESFKNQIDCDWVALIAAQYALKDEARRSTPSAIGACVG